MTMFAIMAASKRKFVDVQQTGKLEEIARRSNVGQPQGQTTANNTHDKHTR